MIAAPGLIIIHGISSDYVLFTNSSWMSAGRLAYFFISMPIYFVYAHILIKGSFPKSNLKAIYLFIPGIVTSALYYLEPSDIFMEMLFADSLPMYMGINLLFFWGLIYLIFTDIDGLGKAFAGIIIVSIIFYAPVCIFITGLKLSVKYTVNPIEYNWAMVKYIFTILLVAFFHLPIFLSMKDKY